MKLDYHPTYVFPTAIHVDWNKDIEGDECFYRVSHFEVFE
ncbi:DUF6174 domain-containing protein [Pseudoalteromonas umbrosa]